MSQVNAYAALSPNAPLEPFTYTLGDIASDEVDIAVEHCGICHSDLSMIENAWEMSSYPLVPGHEVVGRVTAKGSSVHHLQEGQLVGLGWHAGYCMTCSSCLSGDHNLCGSAEATIVGHHGGFADRVRAQAASVIPIPEGIDPAKAGPLFCGGITVFNPLIQYDLSPTSTVGVIGIGGLGHLALQFLRAWGCHVTAFSSNASKEKELKEMGAHRILNSRDPSLFEQFAGQFDLIISTVTVTLDWPAYISLLGPKGRLHFVGAAIEPIEAQAFSLIMAQRSLSGSPVGSPATISSMLSFAARHQIAPLTEHFPLAKVNDALDHLRSGKARYRIVLDCS